jgi:membrane carboxypeptidase/penicillin-binding protein
VGFSNEVTVAVWLGYDNADKRRTLGGGATGGGVAVPIFEPVIEAVWAHVTPRTALAPPSAEAKQHLSCTSAGSGISECLRKDAKGRIADTQYRLISRAHASARRERDDEPSHRVRSARRDRDDEASHRVRRQATSAHVVLRRSSYGSWGWGWGAPQYYWRW